MVSDVGEYDGVFVLLKVVIWWVLDCDLCYRCGCLVRFDWCYDVVL